VETAVAWKCALEERDSPHALVLTRQGLPLQARDSNTVDAIERGGYVLRDSDGDPDAVIIATGSEVKLAVGAAEQLTAEGLAVRVVSMPNPERFQSQDDRYRDAVLPPAVTARVAVEAGVTTGWQRFVGDRGIVIGVDRFGASAPADVLFEHYGLTVDAVTAAVREARG
jgi:transketolase